MKLFWDTKFTNLILNRRPPPPLPECLLMKINDLVNWYKSINSSDKLNYINDNDRTLNCELFPIWTYNWLDVSASADCRLYQSLIDQLI